MTQTIIIIAIVLGIVAWFVFGMPSVMVANALWPDAPAPWENVIGYYFPNTSDRAHGVMTEDSGSIGQCRSWANITIAASSDANGEHSDYWCGIGCSKPADVKTCRATVK